VISADDLPAPQSGESFSDMPVAMASPLHDGYHAAKEQVLATFEKEYVTRLVSRASGNMSRAARLASVDRTTLYRLLERHGFRRDANDSVGV
jgi:DNA-binding NtrC family response regulator